MFSLPPSWLDTPASLWQFPPPDKQVTTEGMGSTLDQATVIHPLCPQIESFLNQTPYREEYTLLLQCLLFTIRVCVQSFVFSLYINFYIYAYQLSMTMNTPHMSAVISFLSTLKISARRYQHNHFLPPL